MQQYFLFYDTKHIPISTFLFSVVFEANLPAPNIPGTSSSSSHQSLQHSVSDFQIRQSEPNAAITSGSVEGTFPRSTSTQFPDRQTTPRKSQESDWDRSGKEQRKIYLFARSSRGNILTFEYLFLILLKFFFRERAVVPQVHILTFTLYLLSWAVYLLLITT